MYQGYRNRDVHPIYYLLQISFHLNALIPGKISESPQMK